MLTPENLSYCKDMHKQHAGECGVSRVGLIFTDNTYWKSSNTACHAGLKYIKNDADCKKDLKGVWSVYKKPHEDLDLPSQKKFVNWMVNESPYADTFLLKDVDSIINGCWVSDPNTHYNLMVAGSIATRFITESYYLNNSRVWAELVNNGADPTYAYVLAQGFKTSGHKTWPIRPGSGDSHTGVQFSFSSIELSRNFIKRNIQQKGYPTYNEVKKYDDLTELFSSNHASSKDLRKWIEKARPIKNSMHISYNIFSQNKKKTNVLADVEDLMSVYNQFVKEIG